MIRLEPSTPADEEITVVHSLRSIVACLIGTFVLRMAAGVMGNMIHLYLADVDKFSMPISFTVRSAITAVFFFPELFLSPVLGAWSDRYGRKLFILIGPIAGAIAVQLTALTPVAWGVFFLIVIAVTRFLEGLSTASAIPATLSYLSALTAKDEKLRGRVMGAFEVATFGGIIFGIFAGGRLYDLFRHNAFHLNSLIYLVSLAVFAFGLLEAQQITKQVKRFSPGDNLAIARQALRNAFAGIRVALRTDVLLFAPAWLAINTLPGLWQNNITGILRSSGARFPDQLLFGLLRDSPHFGRQISDVAVIVLGFFTLGIVLWSLVVGRFRRTSLMLVCSLALFVVVAMLFLTNHAGACGFGSVPANLADCAKELRLQSPAIPFYLALGALGLMFVSGFTPAALTYLADITEKSPVNRGAIMGLYTVLFGLGQLSGEFFGGPFGDWLGFDGLILFTFLLSLVSIGTLTQLYWKENHSTNLPAR